MRYKTERILKGLGLGALTLGFVGGIATIGYLFANPPGPGDSDKTLRFDARRALRNVEGYITNLQFELDALNDDSLNEISIDITSCFNKKKIDGVKMMKTLDALEEQAEKITDKRTGELENRIFAAKKAVYDATWKQSVKNLFYKAKYLESTSVQTRKDLENTEDIYKNYQLNGKAVYKYSRQGDRDKCESCSISQVLDTFKWGGQVINNFVDSVNIETKGNRAYIYTDPVTGKSTSGPGMSSWGGVTKDWMKDKETATSSIWRFDGGYYDDFTSGPIKDIHYDDDKGFVISSIEGWWFASFGIPTEIYDIEYSFKVDEKGRYAGSRYFESASEGKPSTYEYKSSYLISNNESYTALCNLAFEKFEKATAKDTPNVEAE